MQSHGSLCPEGLTDNLESSVCFAFVRNCSILPLSSFADSFVQFYYNLLLARERDSASIQVFENWALTPDFRVQNFSLERYQIFILFVL